MSGRSGPPPMKFGNPGERLRKKKWNLDEMPKFEKNFYTEHPEVQRISQVNHYISLFLPSHTHFQSTSWKVWCFIELICQMEIMKKMLDLSVFPSWSSVLLQLWHTVIPDVMPPHNHISILGQSNFSSRYYKNIIDLHTINVQPCMFWLLSSLLPPYPVWNGRVLQKEGDHHQRFWLSKGRHCFSPGTVSTLVNNTIYKW